MKERYRRGWGRVCYFLHYQCPLLDGSRSQSKGPLGYPLWAVNLRSPVTPQHLDQNKKDEGGQTGRFLGLEEFVGAI